MTTKSNKIVARLGKLLSGAGAAPDLPHRQQLLQQIFQPDQYRWWHGLAFGIAANLISALNTGRRADDRQYYEGLRQAPFAPPGWVFGPAWAINNISVLWGNLRLLNLPEATPHRRTILGLQGASWAIYSSFSYVYFNKRSPILACTWTSGMYLLTIISILLTSKIDRKIALSLATLFVWLSLATPVAAYQMIYNPDPLLDTPAWR